MYMYRYVNEYCLFQKNVLFLVKGYYKKKICLTMILTWIVNFNVGNKHLFEFRPAFSCTGNDNNDNKCNLYSTKSTLWSAQVNLVVHV